MRRILTPFRRMTSLTARMTSPFLRQIEPGTSSMAPTRGPDSRHSGAHAPQTNREFADAAIRTCRTLW